MIQGLTDRKKQLTAQIDEMHEQGQLAHLVDDKNSQKYNGEGITVALCPGKVKREWFPEVQSKIDELQKQIKEVEYLAERRGEFVDQRSNSYWRVSLAKEL